jgi:hypothetical protein
MYSNCETRRGRITIEIGFRAAIPRGFCLGGKIELKLSCRGAAYLNQRMRADTPPRKWQALMKTPMSLRCVDDAQAVRREETLSAPEPAGLEVVGEFPKFELRKNGCACDLMQDARGKTNRSVCPAGTRESG